MGWPFTVYIADKYDDDLAKLRRCLMASKRFAWVRFITRGQDDTGPAIEFPEISWEVFYAAVPLDYGKELGKRLPYILLQQWGV